MRESMLVSYFKQKMSSFLFVLVVLTINMLGSPAELVVKELLATITTTVGKLIGSGPVSLMDGVPSVLVSTELMLAKVIYALLMLMCVVIMVATTVDITYISIPEARAIIDRLKITPFKIEYETGLVELANQMGIEMELLPTLYSLEVIRGADKTNYEKPFTATIKIKSRYNEFKEIAQKYKNTQYFCSFKDRDAFLKQLETELSDSYNDVMCARLKEITDPEDIIILKKVLCNFGGIFEENEIATCNIETHYKKENNTISCKVSVHPKSELIRERFEAILSSKADETGDIVTARVFDDIVLVVKFIRTTINKIMDREEVDKVRGIMQQDILSTMKPLEIEDDVIIHNMKSAGSKQGIK